MHIGRLALSVLAAVGVMGPGPCSRHDDGESSREHHHEDTDGGSPSPFNPTAPNCGLVETFDAGVLTDVFPVPCPGGDIIVPPQAVTRTAGAPREVEHRFSMNPGGDVCVGLKNAGTASAKVGIDDDDNVFSPADFNPNVTELSRRKTLGAGGHVLEMEVRSAPGSSITVTVLRALTPPPLPPGVLAQGPAALLQLTAINADPRGISPENQDGRFDTTSLNANFRVLVPERFAREPEEHTYRVEYTWKVASEACTVVHSIKSTQAIPLPPVPSEDEDEDGNGSSSSGDHSNNGHGNDQGDEGGSSSSSSSSGGGGDDDTHDGDRPDFDAMLWAPFGVAGTWDGRDDAGAFVPDGTYKVFLEAVVIRTDLDDDDDSDGDGTADHDDDDDGELPGTAELPEEHLVDGLTSPFVPVLVDNTPPPLTVEPLPICTAVSSLAFAGTSEPAAMVTVTLAEVSTEIIIGADGNWNVLLTLPANAESAFSISARDALYNVTTGPSGTVTHDDIDPVVDISAPADNVIVPEATVDVAASATDANLRHVLVNNMLVFPWNWSAFTATLVVPLTGTLLIVVTASDCAGNATTELRHVQRSATCSSSQECETLVLSQPDLACSKVGECNPSGWCDFTDLVKPSSFCDGNQLMVWGCTVASTAAGPMRKWKCEAGETCGQRIGCMNTQCVPGLQECRRTPAPDGDPCALGGDGVAAHCVGEESIWQPFCETGACVADPNRVLTRPCVDDAPSVDSECWSAKCKNNASTAFCDLATNTGQRCGSCSGPGAAYQGTPCDLCGEPSECTSTGLCEVKPPVACTTGDVCTTSFCDPWSGVCVDPPQPVCPPGNTCTPSADGPICLPTP